MHKSTLVQAYRALSKKDIRELRKFVRSPYFNQREDVIRLFDYLAEAVEKGAEALHRERAYAFVFPGQPYDDAWMKLVMHFLLNNIRQYFALQEVEADDDTTVASSDDEHDDEEMEEEKDEEVWEEEEEIENHVHVIEDSDDEEEDRYRRIVDLWEKQQWIVTKKLGGKFIYYLKNSLLS